MESNSVNQLLTDAFSGALEIDSRKRIGELEDHLRRSSEADLCARLLSFDLADDRHRLSTSAAINHATRFLAPEDQPPAAGVEKEAWQILLSFVELRHGSGVYPMGRLSFVSDSLMRGLAEEARVARPAASNGRTTAGAGDLLAGLAVSRQLREAVSSAVATPVVPTYDAIYEFDPPHSAVRCHTDSDGFEFTAHLLIEHISKRIERPSVLSVFAATDQAPRHIALKTGETVVIRGRGTIHRWEKLGEDEHRVLAAIGFRASTARRFVFPG